MHDILCLDDRGKKSGQSNRGCTRRGLLQMLFGGAAALTLPLTSVSLLQGCAPTLSDGREITPGLIIASGTINADGVSADDLLWGLVGETIYDEIRGFVRVEDEYGNPLQMPGGYASEVTPTTPLPQGTFVIFRVVNGQEAILGAYVLGGASAGVTLAEVVTHYSSSEEQGYAVVIVREGRVMTDLNDYLADSDIVFLL